MPNMIKKCLSVILIVALLHSHTISSFTPTTYSLRKTLTNRQCRVSVRNLLSTTLYEKDGNNDEKVRLGTKEYYAGFVTRDVGTDEMTDSKRVTGDAVLGPTLKFVGGISVVIVGLLLAFLGSNGLL